MDTYLMEYYDETIDSLKEYYRDHFTLGCLACDIGSKFALISLICFLTKQARVKNPKATTLQVIQKVRQGKESHNSRALIMGLAVICDDFMRNTTEFLTFGMKTAKDMVTKINEILDGELPWEDIKDDLPF